MPLVRDCIHSLDRSFVPVFRGLPARLINRIYVVLGPSELQARMKRSEPI